MEKRKPRTVSCPTCGKAVEWAPENPWRPFCSERCKNVDLGAWAAEEYRVPQAPGNSIELPDRSES